MSRIPSCRHTLHVAVFVDTAGNYGRGLLEGIAEYQEAHGPWSMFLQPRATGQFDLAWLRRWKGDGVLAFVEQRDMAQRLRKLRIPLVETYGHLRDLNVPRVANDDLAIGRLAAEHLLSRQFEHLAYSGYPDQLWVELRYEGFGQTLAEAGRGCERHVHPRSFASLEQWEKAQQDLTRWLRKLPKPLGVMTCSDRHALNVLEACRRAGLAVPDQVAVIGVDNDAPLCRLSDPPLSSVADNPGKIGYEAARLLDQLMTEKHEPQSLEPILVPPLGVVARRSTDVTVTADPQVREALRFIREHACQEIDVKSVLRHVRSSRSAFYRRFSAAMGHPVHEEILRARLDRVKYLAAQTSMPLARVAEVAGFEYPEYMGAAFKRRFGLTPGQYRARHRPGASAKE